MKTSTLSVPPQLQRLLPRQGDAENHVVTVDGPMHGKDELVCTFRKYDTEGPLPPGFAGEVKPAVQGAIFKGFTVVQDAQGPHSTVYVLRPGQDPEVLPDTTLSFRNACRDGLGEVHEIVLDNGQVQQSLFTRGGTEVTAGTHKYLSWNEGHRWRHDVHQGGRDAQRNESWNVYRPTGHPGDMAVTANGRQIAFADGLQAQ
ncbi:MAG TPA: hypothetical protein VGO93_02000, partial [Candidatus Xenobia bacterium]